jgi:hypothetical protein
MTLLTDALAYSLQEGSTGWSWRVYDLEGEIVATGEAVTKQRAEADLERVYAARSKAAPLD